jgi:hypothetical protein
MRHEIWGNGDQSPAKIQSRRDDSMVGQRILLHLLLLFRTKEPINTEENKLSRGRLLGDAT